MSATMKPETRQMLNKLAKRSPIFALVKAILSKKAPK